MVLKNSLFFAFIVGNCVLLAGLLHMVFFGRGMERIATLGLVMAILAVAAARYGTDSLGPPRMPCKKSVRPVLVSSNANPEFFDVSGTHDLDDSILAWYYVNINASKL